MAVAFSGPVKSGTCFANGAVVDATPGAIILEVRTDSGSLRYQVSKGSHHMAAYTAAMVALALMDGQGYNVVEVRTPNEVVVEHMNERWDIGTDRLRQPWASLLNMCNECFNKVTFTKI